MEAFIIKTAKAYDTDTKKPGSVFGSVFSVLQLP